MWKHLFLTMLWYSRISWNISFLPNLAASVRGVSPKLFLMNVSPRILCFLCVAWKNMSCNETILDQYNKTVSHTHALVGEFFPIEFEPTDTVQPSAGHTIKFQESNLRSSKYRISFHVCNSFNVKERKKDRKVKSSRLQVQIKKWLKITRNRNRRCILAKAK